MLIFLNKIVGFDEKSSGMTCSTVCHCDNLNRYFAYRTKKLTWSPMEK